MTDNEKKNLDKNDDTNRTDWANGIGFIFKKCSAPKSSLAYWVRVPEFVEKISNAKENAITVDESYILHIMREIYEKKQYDKNNGIETDFNFHLSRQALKALSDSLSGNRNMWKDL